MIFLILFFNPIESLSSNPNIIWHQTYGEGGVESAYSIIQTDDNGFAIIGSTTDGVGHGSNIWLLKTDENGSVEWSQIFGGEYNDDGYEIIQTMDNGFALIGHTDNSMWLIKTDSKGNIEWNKTYPGERGYNLVQNEDGGYLLSGKYSGFIDQICIIKTNSTGEIEWIQTNPSYGYYNYNSPLNTGTFVHTVDNGFAIASSTYGNSSEDILFTKGILNGTFEIDHKNNKTIEIQKTYGSLEDDFVTSMIQTKDSGFVIVGYIVHDAYNFEPFILKIDNNGTEQFFQSFGRSMIDIIYSVIQTADGGFTLAGTTFTNPNFNDGDMWLIKTDEQGNSLWNQSFGGNKLDGANSLIQTSDECFVLAGHTKSYGDYDLWLVKTADVYPIEYNATTTWFLYFETLIFLIVLVTFFRKEKRFN